MSWTTSGSVRGSTVKGVETGLDDDDGWIVSGARVTASVLKHGLGVYPSDARIDG